MSGLINICQPFVNNLSQNNKSNYSLGKGMDRPTKSFQRNTRLSVAGVKNKAEENFLNIELGHLEKEKKTALRMLQNDKQSFKLKYGKRNRFYGDGSPSEVNRK